MEQSKEIIQLRSEVDSLRKIVESLSLLMNKEIISELYREHEKIKEGEYLSEEDFEKEHGMKIN